MHKLTARQRADKERKDPVEEDPEFQIAPMIDILLVLLVFFMTISSTEVLQTNKNILLPVAKEGKDASKNKPSQIIVNVLWNPMNNVGSIDIDGTAFPDAGQIIPRLRRAVEVSPLTRVLIRGDKAVKYEFLRTVLEAAGKSGITSVTFSVVNKEMPPPPGR
jgi:biopolymer transport protein ExbD